MLVFPHTSKQLVNSGSRDEVVGSDTRLEKSESGTIALFKCVFLLKSFPFEDYLKGNLDCASF